MRIEDGKKHYEDIEIPNELSSMVSGLIEKDRTKRGLYDDGRAKPSLDDGKLQGTDIRDGQTIIDLKKRKGALYMMKRTAAAAAAVLAVFTLGLNTSEAFAEGAASLPVIGQIARVLTVRSYHVNEGDYRIDMEMPAVDTAGTSVQTDTDFTALVNSQIEKIVDDYTAQAKTEFQEYKEAFFATGGTEAEWADRQMDINVDYEVKYQQGTVLSLELMTSKSWVSSQEERHYYNLDLVTGQELSLNQLLGENWKELCNAEIDKQIKEQLADDPGLSYFGYGDNELSDAKFSSVTEDTDFYINADGQVVLVFPKYDIAPGYMGFREFAVGKANL